MSRVSSVQVHAYTVTFCLFDMLTVDCDASFAFMLVIAYVHSNEHILLGTSVYTLSSRAYGRLFNTFANAHPTVQYKSILYIIISVFKTNG